MLFHDRTYAAFLLEERLREYRNCDGVVLAVPRGGVPIGYHVARLLNLPLDIIISKKIGHPVNEEFAIGSVSVDDVVLDLRNSRGIPHAYIVQKTRQLKEEIANKYRLLMGSRSSVPMKGKVIILVDDGIATGNTILACVKSIRKQQPGKIIIAVPVASTTAHRLLAPEVDEFICLLLPHYFRAVGEFYENFTPVSDAEAQRLLHKAEAEGTVVA